MTDASTELATYQQIEELMRVCRSAVCEAQSESRRLGVPNVYCFNGQIVYELPTGELTRTPPPLLAADANHRRTSA